MDAADDGLVPAALVAVTVKVWGVSLASPVIVIGLLRMPNHIGLSNDRNPAVKSDSFFWHNAFL